MKKIQFYGGYIVREIAAAGTQKGKRLYAFIDIFGNNNGQTWVNESEVVTMFLPTTPIEQLRPEPQTFAIMTENGTTLKVSPECTMYSYVE